jgi:hypothetical protein
MAPVKGPSLLVTVVVTMLDDHDLLVVAMVPAARLPSGYRKDKHHSFTTEDHGLPELKSHLTKVMAYMMPPPMTPSS